MGARHAHPLLEIPMPRLRSMTAAALLALTLFAALPSAAWSLRDRDQAVANTTSDSWGSRVTGVFDRWGDSALRWFRALIAREHGQIVQSPAVPPPPGP